MENAPKYKVTLFWDLDLHVDFTSKIVTGLVLLARSGKIQLCPRVGFSSSETGRPQGSVLVWLEVQRLSDNERLLVSVDLHDLSFQLNEQALASCDVYLKRSFYPPDLEKVPATLRQKVIPFGLNFSCAVNASKRMVWAWLLRVYTARFLRSPRESLVHFRRRLGEYRVFIDGPTLRDYEQSPHAVVDHKVVFQTRVWAREEVGPDNHEIVNEQRVSIIRTLRQGLGSQLVGGLIPTELARQQYSDVLATASARRRLFIRWSKRNLIGVYVRGLNYSCGFRLAEHLAAAQCIVADTSGLRNHLPIPLKEGEHYLPFTTPEECLQQCRRLLEDNDLAARMRQANWEYYRCEVEPAQHVWNCLERAFAHADSTG